MRLLEGFTFDETMLLFVVILALCIVVLMAMHSDSSGQALPTWTPRPTALPGTPTHEVFLPLVANEKPIATPIPRPTIGE